MDLEAIVWTGPQPSTAEVAARGGVDDTAPWLALAPRVAQARADGRRVHVLPPYRAENRLRLMDLLDRRSAPEASVPFVRAVVEQRAVKSAEENADIERAVDLTVDMHLAGMRMARPGLREADIAARVTEIALAGGAGPSFPVIATVRGETLRAPRAAGRPRRARIRRDGAIVEGNNVHDFVPFVAAMPSASLLDVVVIADYLVGITAFGVYPTRAW